jgi:acyl-CoA thioester hydrolase
MPTFRTSRRIEFVDTDMAGIVHFSNFFRFMEAAEVSFLQTLGLSVKMQWEGQHLGFPRVSASCDFLRPLRFEDIVDIAVTLEKLGRKSVTYAFEFSHQQQPVARGRVTSVCCLVLPDNRFESIDIPESIRLKLLNASG